MHFTFGTVEALDFKYKVGVMHFTFGTLMLHFWNAN